METEVQNLFKVWITIFASLAFCHYIVRRLPKGKTRFISLMPIISLFTFLPLKLSTIHCVGITTGFITWLANFKLLLFAFNQGALSAKPSISLPIFVSVACLPVEIKHISYPQTSENGLEAENHESSSQKILKKGLKSPLNYAIKLLLLVLIIYTYKYKQYMHKHLLLFLHCCHIYFSTELILAMIVAPVQAMLGVEIEPLFDEPYLSTSLQDFWGRRWNLMVSSILWQTIYNPIRSILSPILGRRWALLPAVVASFLVSGLMHELLFFYQSGGKPTWEVTCFFVLHGVCIALEILLKQALRGRWKLHRVIYGLLTVGFVVVTGSWLFLPQLIRDGSFVKIVEEYGVMNKFVKREILRPLRLI